MSKKHDDKDNIIEEAYEEMTTFEDSFVKHWPLILNVSIGIVILFAVFLAFRNFAGKQDAATSSEFAAAKTVQELQKAIAAHPSHPAADFARLRAVKLLGDDRKYDEALRICREISKPGKNPDAFWRAKLDEGYLLEMLGRKDEAAEAFSKTASDMKFPAEVRHEASYSAGRLFLASGKKDKALAALKSAEGAAGAEDLWTYQAKALLVQIN